MNVHMLVILHPCQMTNKGLSSVSGEVCDNTLLTIKESVTVSSRHTMECKPCPQDIKYMYSNKITMCQIHQHRCMMERSRMQQNHQYSSFNKCYGNGDTWMIRRLLHLGCGEGNLCQTHMHHACTRVNMHPHMRACNHPSSLPQHTHKKEDRHKITYTCTPTHKHKYSQSIHPLLPPPPPQFSPPPLPFWSVLTHKHTHTHTHTHLSPNHGICFCPMKLHDPNSCSLNMIQQMIFCSFKKKRITESKAI